ncbi:mechanosensitive ion channel family protein [Sphingomonas hylomeconis]|uniref:Mechanosensitive ion channel family protein n=1 Tax=Sphingomonas hylomeconis TaxID=1395958 RepID=A0ABV7SRK9_9SPHN
MAAWFAAAGILLNQHTLTEGAIAGGLVLLSLTLGVVASRTLGPAAAEAWHRRLDHRGEGLAGRLTLIIRHTTAAVLLAIVAGVHGWPPVAAIPIGLALGAATALAAYEVLRGVSIARPLIWAVTLILFVALFSRAVGGLAEITFTLQKIGFDVGSRRFSLLALITMLITLVGLFAAVRVINRATGHLIAATNGFDATQKLLAQKLASIAVIVAAFFIGIDLLGVDLTAFAVFSGAFGLAVGFGLQKTIGNLIAGIILLMDRSIKPGDVIVVGDSFGWVNKIGVRAVSVLTRDGKEHLIPNENLMTQEVENWSFTDRNVRVRIPVRVAYDCDLQQAQRLMLQATTDSPRVLDDPPPNVWLTAFGENGVEHEILAWISDPQGGVGNVRSDVLNRLWLLFKQHGIVIPYPQRDVRLRLPEPPADN